MDGSGGGAYPASPRWNVERPYLTGRMYQVRISPATDGFLPELLIIDDLLSALVGIEGRYITIKKARGAEEHFTYQMDLSMDLVLQELTKRIFPICENFLVINQFVESRSHFRYGLVNHAFAAALRAFLLDYQAMVAQLEHQFRLGKLSLQGLWFFCQPMMGSVQALATVIQKVSTNYLMGSAVLNLLQAQAAAMAGDNTVRSLLEKMIHHASSAYLCILERWVYEGIIDDPYGELFIAENKSLQKESLTQDYDAKYWQQRYSLKDGIPSFLTNAADKILTTGKYLNVMRECGHSVQVPLSETSKLTNFGSNHHYLECINTAYDFASSELLNLLKKKYDLVGKLRSLKHYFLLDQGDFLVHFMDMARDELLKKPDEISVEKLQSLLDLALRTSVAAADPFHEDLTCCVERTSLLNRLGTLKDLEGITNSLVAPLNFLDISGSAVNTSDHAETVNLTGLETFTLSYKVQWPLSLVISRKALTKYQLIFRLLFHCNHVHRQLCAAWQVHQVLEPNWHVMYDRLQTAKSIDEVMRCHENFLERCLQECLFLAPQLLKGIEKLKLICLQYSAAVQWLVPSLFIPDADYIDRRKRVEKSKAGRSTHRGHRLKLAAENASATDTVIKFEKEFNTELQSLGPILSRSSQADPYLSQLAQLLLGTRNDI
ncbi:Gamma-tubulin complex component 2 [Nymphaea thermarum]|nr:Gamma-tubulin complex component 2 [Nymphaea thermarum]